MAKKEGLKTKLVNYLKAQRGKHIDSFQIELLCKQWNYKISNGERRLREAKEIGKQYKDGVIVAYYYIQPSQFSQVVKQMEKDLNNKVKEFCCIENFKKTGTHNSKCFKLKKYFNEKNKDYQTEIRFS